MKIDKTNKKNTVVYIVLFVIILLQLVRIIYYFAFIKEDFHSDEMWSFGLSNSYYEPFIYQSADHSKFINYENWIPSKAMRDYLTVSDDHRFSYDSVYYNQVHDYHPPLYYFILHTICSFFPDQFSPWFGFSINIVVFIITMIYLYKLITVISKSEFTALVGCLFYGFSVGALNTFIYVRMYCMETMFSVVLMYLHTKIYKDIPSKKMMLSLFGVTLLGCLTHHFFIPYAGCISACFCIYYLVGKKYKQLLKYSVIMLSSVVASLLLFPATIDHLFSGRINDVKLPFSWQIKMTLNCMLNELFGFVISVVPTISYTALLITIVCIAVIISPLFFLFRNEVWFRNMLSYIRKKASCLKNKIIHMDVILVSIIVSSAGIIILTSLTVSVINMWRTTDRYIFSVFPGVVVLFVIFLDYLARVIIKKAIVSKSIVIIISSAVCICTNVNGYYNYIYIKPQDSIPVSSVIKDSNCAIIINKEIFLLTCFTKDSMNSDNIYVTLSDDLSDKITDMPDPPDAMNKEYIFIDDRSFYKESVNETLEGTLPVKEMSADQTGKLKREEFEEAVLKRYSMCEYIGYDTVFERPFSIYRVK